MKLQNSSLMAGLHHMVPLPGILDQEDQPGWWDGLLMSVITDQNFIPAHRVVNRNGLLTGKHHFGNSTTNGTTS